MKFIVIYFSQTGNTEKIARAIGAGVSQAAGGLGFPVMGAEPGNVTAFIERLRFVGQKAPYPTTGHPD